MMTIGELGKKTGMNIETIRYYERIGLLPAPGRHANGRRLYHQRDAKRLAFVRHGRDLGFDLTVIRTLLALQETPEASCVKVTEIAQGQLEAVDDRIARLCVLRDELFRITTECAGGRMAECRIIEALADHGAIKHLG
ncbi:MerR family transcriptional regulator [Devosia sp.]|uniref:MerR family transcriptional regulator n=1 Tax=Devosia sp. TaxID=1871048 RepID=UPI003F72523E